MSKFLSLICALVAMSHTTGASAVDLTNLRCEYLVNPMGIDVVKPRLSWVIGERGQETGDRGQNAEVRGQKQTAYQVLVASTPEL